MICKRLKSSNFSQLDFLFLKQDSVQCSGGSLEDSSVVSQSHVGGSGRRFPHPTNGSLSVLPTVALTTAHNMKPTGSLELGCNMEITEDYSAPEKGKFLICSNFSCSD